MSERKPTKWPFSHLLSGTLLAVWLTVSGCGAAPWEKSSAERLKLRESAERLIAGSSMEEDFKVLRQHGSTEVYGTLTGYAHLSTGNALEYGFRDDGSVWALEDGEEDESRKWIDCDPAGKCVSGIGMASIDKHLSDTADKRMLLKLKGALMGQLDSKP